MSRERFCNHFVEVFIMSKNDLQYYESQQCSLQWRAFLNAFSAEFSTKGDLKDLRLFMHQLGRNMAQNLGFKGGDSLQLLEDNMNAIWGRMHWGWVEVNEEAEALVLLHHASPLKAAFGEQSLSWTPALLEGIYASWFEGMGMDPSLRLQQKAGDSGIAQVLVFELKRQVEESPFFGRR